MRSRSGSIRSDQSSPLISSDLIASAAGDVPGTRSRKIRSGCAEAEVRPSVLRQPRRQGAANGKGRRDCRRRRRIRRQARPMLGEIESTSENMRTISSQTFGSDESGDSRLVNSPSPASPAAYPASVLARLASDSLSRDNSAPASARGGTIFGFVPVSPVRTDMTHPPLKVPGKGRCGLGEVFGRKPSRRCKGLFVSGECIIFAEPQVGPPGDNVGQLDQCDKFRRTGRLGESKDRLVMKPDYLR